MSKDLRGVIKNNNNYSHYCNESRWVYGVCTVYGEGQGEKEG